MLQVTIKFMFVITFVINVFWKQRFLWFL